MTNAETIAGASALANEICGCATREQHKRDINAVLAYREAAEAPLRAEIAAKDAEIARLRDALHDAICMIGHAMPSDTTILAGRRMVAREVWKAGYTLLHPRAALAGDQPTQEQEQG